jgi:aromatic ring hydroxylase
MPNPSSYRLNTTLQPVAAGVLAALAMREDLKNHAANQVLERLLREEIERLLPGLWDQLVFGGRPLSADAREAAADVAELVATRLRARAAP